MSGARPRITAEQRTAAMLAVRDEIVAHAPEDIRDEVRRYLTDSKALESHQALFERNLSVLEGIVLDQVPEGIYSLIALPLRLKDADASPVRAILLEAGSLR